MPSGYIDKYSINGTEYYLRDSATAAGIAPQYADLTFPVSAGQFCWYSGVLYKAKADITTSESWTAAHWEAVTVSGEVAGLKSATISKTDNIASFVPTMSAEPVLDIVETDPTVPSWAKAENKPAYTATEITSTDGTVQSDITGIKSDKISKTDNIPEFIPILSAEPVLDVDVTEQVKQTISESTELAEAIVNNTDEKQGQFSPDGIDPAIVETISTIESDVSTLKGTKVPYPEVSPYGTSGHVLSTLGNGKTEWIAPVTPSSSDVGSAVEAWLSDHPEATTTVQDHSLTYVKMVNGTLNFVTPEMYGAVGDGVTDDAPAIQLAISAGDYVLFRKKTYLVGTTLEIDHGDIVIDFNGADIICTANSLIRAVSEFDTTLYTGEYTAKSTYGYGTGNGLVKISSMEHVHYGREYYYKGGTYYSANGHLNGAMPYSIAACTMYGQSNPLKNITIKNLGSYTNNNMVAFNSSGIKLQGVYDSLIENCRLAPANHNYIGVEIVSCSNIKVRDCVIELIDTTNNNTYGISFGDSSFTTIEGCRIYSEQWDCITTGGGGTSNHALISNCILSVSPTAMSARAYDDHANSLDVKIVHCKIVGDVAISDGLVEDCDIFPRTQNVARCNFQAWVGSEVKPNATFRDIRSYAGSIYFMVSRDIQNGIGSNLLMQIGTMTVQNIRGSALISVLDSNTPSSVTEFNYENLIVDGVIANLSLMQVFKKIQISNSKITSLRFQPSDYDSRLNHTTTIKMVNCETTAIQNGTFEIELQADNCTFDDFFNYGTANPSMVQISNCRNKSTGTVILKAVRNFQLSNCFFDSSTIALSEHTGIVQAYNLSGSSGCPSDLYKADNASSYSKKMSPVSTWTNENI